MNVTVIGSGYVGLVQAVCLADVGNNVVCFDLDANKIANLQEGIAPFTETGLEELIKRNMSAGRLSFTTDPQLAGAHGTIQFIAVGTPRGKDSGSVDFSSVLSAAESLGKYIDRYTIIVNKATVPVGTTELVREKIQSELAKRGCHVDFDVVSNPEFLKEGVTILDFMRPDRVIIGTSSDRAFGIMLDLYGAFAFGRDKIIRMDERSAEFTKYAANSMLAMRVSFMNELSRLCEHLGVDITLVRKGIGSDKRIGMDFLYPGCGYGGSCFPKDLQALIYTGQEHGINLSILEAVEQVNEDQKKILSKKVVEHFGDISGKRFALWGLSFKPGTSDMREAPSISIIRHLILSSAEVVCYDPIAIFEAQKIFSGETSVSFVDSARIALMDVDALIIATEWKEFRSPDWDEMKKLMKNPIIFDGRNIYHPEVPRKNGFTYFSIGRP